MADKPKKPILIVDDEQDWRSTIKTILHVEAGFNNVLECSDSRQTLELLRKVPCSLVLLDLNMPQLSGLELLPQILEEFPTVKVLIFSGVNQVETAIECVRKGAFNYVIKSTELGQLIISIHNALWAQSLAEENLVIRKAFLSESLQHPHCFSHIITQCPKMSTIFRYCEALSHSPEPVLISGESGTGKELVAQALHKLFCPDKPLISFNVAGLDDNAFSDTLFGHIKGSYTGAIEARKGLIDYAGQGVVFFDEIGDLSRDSQLKLLRLLQEGEYFPLGSDSVRKSQARFIFATNRNLEEMVAQGAFRSDLLYRLNAHHVQLPPLRQRPRDIPLLVDHYIQEAAAQMNRSDLTVTREVYRLLQAYSFPGNIRELRALIYDAAARAIAGPIGAEYFVEKIAVKGGAAKHSVDAVTAGAGVIFTGALPTLKEINRVVIDEAMNRAGGNHRKAAELLGITRSALSKRLAKM